MGRRISRSDLVLAAVVALPIALCLVPLRSRAQQAEINIHFENAQSEPGGKEAARLDSLIAAVGRSNIHEIIVVGHADSIGNGRFNAQIAAKRAESVRQLLLARQLPDSLIQLHSSGALVPIAENITETGRARNRRVFVRVEYGVPIDPAEPLPALIGRCREDTLIVIDETLRFRVNKCQEIACLTGYEALSFQDFVRNGLRTVNASGNVFVACGAYRNRLQQACDTDLVFDPPLRVEVAVPKGITAAAARELFGMFGGDGRWIGHGKENIKVRLKREHERTIAVFSVHRLTPYFSVCCAGVKRSKKVRIRFKGGLQPEAVSVHARSPFVGRPLERKGRHQWRGMLPCAEGYVLSVLLAAPDGSKVLHHVELGRAAHRVQLLGRRCPPMEERGQRLLGIIPTRERALHKTYMVTPAIIERSAPLE